MAVMRKMMVASFLLTDELVDLKIEFWKKGKDINYIKTNNN